MKTPEETKEGFYLSEDGEWIPEGWKIDKLDQHYEFKSGLSKPAKDFGRGYPFLSFKDVFYNYFVPDDLKELVESSEQEQMSCSVSRGDVFLTRTSETLEDLGMSSVALRDYPKTTFNGFCKRLRPKNQESQVFPEYAGYYFRSYRFRSLVTALSSPSTRASLNNEMLSTLSVLRPPLLEQKAIATVLGSLDDKIELLREQNETLEALAQTLFKRWFIDFNFPDENGNPYKDSGGKMVASEFGEIPEGWRVVELKDVINHKKQAVRSDSVSKNAKYVGLEHISRKHLQLTKHGWGKDVSSNKSSFSRGDILFGKLRPYFHKVCIAPFCGICSTDILVLNVVNESWYSFALMHIYSERLIDFVTLASTGTRMPRTNYSEISRYKIALPSAKLAESFNELCGRLFEKTTDNTEQIETLTYIRDTLLPKLMKGEIRVPVASETATL